MMWKMVKVLPTEDYTVRYNLLNYQLPEHIFIKHVVAGNIKRMPGIFDTKLLPCKEAKG